MDNGAANYRRYLDGDTTGIEEVVRYYKDGLILYLYGYVNDLHAAEDLMQETFIKLLVKRPKFSGESSFKTWLYSIGKKTAMKYLRSVSKRAEIALDSVEDTLAEKSELERDYLREEDKKVLYRAMQQLNPEYRQVLYLVYIEEFDHKEVGEIMKKSRRQITNLIYRAKNSLKDRLSKEGYYYEEL